MGEFWTEFVAAAYPARSGDSYVATPAEQHETILAFSAVMGDGQSKRIEKFERAAEKANVNDSAPQHVSKFCAFLIDNWSALVPSGRDRMYPEDMKAALKSNRFTDEQKQYIVAAKGMEGTLNAIGPFSMRTVFLRQGLEKVQKYSAEVGDHQAKMGPAIKFANDNFQRLDPNNNGFLSKDELTRALQTTNVSDRGHLNYLLDNISDFRKAGDDQWMWQSKGISRLAAKQVAHRTTAASTIIGERR